MGQYKKAILTTVGEKLVAQALSGEIQLTITKAKTSNYVYPSDIDYKSLTDLQGVKQIVSDPVTTVQNDTMIQTRALFSNEEITSTYYIQNIGLYTMDGTQEVLFCIVTAETPDEMPQYNGVASTSYIYNIQNVVQDATELNIVVAPSGTATIQEVLERVDATGGDISETVIETLETTEDKYPVPAAGESVKRFLGKVLAFLRNIRPLTSGITIYVSTSEGSDTTGDGSEMSPYASITKALSVVPKDLGGYKATVFVADGTYSENITISGFDNGHLVLRRQGDLVLNSLCNVGSIAIDACDSVVITGFNFTTESTDSVYADRCKFIYISNCQSIASAINNHSFNFEFTTVGRVEGCRSLNHYSCVRSYDSYITSLSWSSDSIGNQYGLYVNGGGQIAKSNIYQPKGNVIDMHYATGGVVVSQYGASIGTLRYDLTIYVATTGSDTSGDGTNNNPFATIQHAINIIPKDLGGYAAIINVADGTYNEDIRILGFYGGEIYVRTSTPNTLSQNTKINTIYVKNCNALVSVSGFQLLGTNDMTVIGIFCSHIYFEALTLATTPATGIGIFIAETSLARVYGCNILGRNYAVRFNNSKGYVNNCTGSSNTYGIFASSSSIIQVVGTTPGATTPKSQEYGGYFINQNGTQISDIISSGLSCTWGTITGGYVRHGNSTGGVAMITICVQVVTTVALSASTEYTISGFPSSNTPTDLAVASNSAPTTHSWFRHSNGQIVMVLTTALGAGGIKQFNITYPTSS